MSVAVSQFAALGVPTGSENFRTRARNCALLTITVVCICIVVLCGVMIVREYSLAKDYEPVVCKVTNITYNPRDMTCTFCESKDKTKERGASECTTTTLPCLNIGVEYTLRGVLRVGQLHPDSLQAAGIHNQCSYSVCLKLYENNKAAVEEFAKKWHQHRKENKAFPCFYNTKFHGTIIAEKMHTKSDVIHSMLWPGIIILICGSIFLRLEMTRRGMGFCGPVQTPGRSSTCDVRNGGSGTGTGANEAKQSLLQVNDNKKEKVQCSLLKKDCGISSSMPALDHLKPPGDYSSKSPPSPGTSSTVKDVPIGSSLSVDGLRLHQVRSLEEGSNSSNRHLLSAIPKDQFRQDSTKTDGGSSTGSQGSKIMGLETPV